MAAAESQIHVFPREFFDYSFFPWDWPLLCREHIREFTHTHTHTHTQKGGGEELEMANMLTKCFAKGPLGGGMGAAARGVGWAEA